jgi:hypothetical protein
VSEPPRFWCECGDPQCRDHVELSFAQYEAARRQPASFVVRPDHVGRDDRVLEWSAAYAVVRTLQAGAAGSLSATEGDTRQEAAS